MFQNSYFEFKYMIPDIIAIPKLKKVPIKIYSVNFLLLLSFKSLNRKNRFCRN